ncbi:MAG TPA: polysaccharide biosynthesis/export family protein [Candidatus Brocadiia bacterium]|nr:polysaccharide biosynthesis/export family protein [Candidatus Brocadiales bacterium]
MPIKRGAMFCALYVFIIVTFLTHSSCSQFRSHDVQPTPVAQPPQGKGFPLEDHLEAVFKGRKPEYQKEAKPFERDYLLGPEDVLEIKVLLSPELDRSIRIGLDGYISYPLIGKVLVAGLTPYELEQKIAELLGEKYLKEPQVSIFVKEYKSRWTAVIGGVEEPGVFPLTKPVNTLVELLSRAGGLSKGQERLAGHKLYVIPAKQKESADMPTIYTISVHELLETGSPELNIEILPGDIIYVPTTEFYFVSGEVKKPGAYALKKKMTVMQALSEAGSFSDIASMKDAKVTKRLPDGREVTVKINFKDVLDGKAENIPVDGGDVLYVGKSTLKVVGAYSQEYAKALSTAFTSGFASAFAFETVRGN